MLSLTELEAFSASHVAARPNLENFFMVASDDELARLYQDTVNAGDLCTLVVVIPFFDGDFQDEDSRTIRNNLYFMVVKKTDIKAGHQARLQIFKTAQEEIKQLLVRILDFYSSGSDCLFRNIDLNSVRMDPVQEYVGANGFMLEFATKTTLK